MNRIILWIGLAAVVVVVAVVLMLPGEPEPETDDPGEAEAAASQIQWKMQSIWSAGTINQDVFVRFCERVGRMSGGRLVIEPLPVGTVVAYNETLDAVGTGILDAQHGAAGYYTGKDPAFALLGDLNGGYESPRHMLMWLEYGGGLELAQELYAEHGLHFVGAVAWGAESIPAKKPIRTMDDFRGVKIRTPEGMGQEIFHKIGAAPVNIPGSEIYTALERGVVDASDWGTLGMNDDLGFHAIAPYPLYPGFHSLPFADVAVNQGRWNELPEDLKRILETAVRAFAVDMLETVTLQDAEVLRTASERGIEPIRWSSEDRRRFREVAAEVWAEYASRGELAQRVYDSHMAFLRQLGLLE